MADGDPSMIHVRRSVVVRVGIAAAVLASLGIGFAVGWAVHSPDTAPTRSASGGTLQHFFENSTTTSAPPTTTTTAPVPLVLVCSGSPAYKPTTMNFACQSACSSYVQAITWTSWTATSAVGTGTLMVNNGVPDCLHGTWTSQTNYPVTLQTPLTVDYCSGTGTQSAALLFTSMNLGNNTSLPEMRPPC